MAKAKKNKMSRGESHLKGRPKSRARGSARSPLMLTAGEPSGGAWMQVHSDHGGGMTHTHVHDAVASNGAAPRRRRRKATVKKSAKKKATTKKTRKRRSSPEAIAARKQKIADRKACAAKLKETRAALKAAKKAEAEAKRAAKKTRKTAAKKVKKAKRAAAKKVRAAKKTTTRTTPKRTKKTASKGRKKSVRKSSAKRTKSASPKRRRKGHKLAVMVPGHKSARRCPHCTGPHSASQHWSHAASHRKKNYQRTSGSRGGVRRRPRQGVLHYLFGG